MPQFENTPRGRVVREIIARVHADNLIGRKLKKRRTAQEAERAGVEGPGRLFSERD